MKHARTDNTPHFASKLLLFAFVSALWLALDRATKLWANGARVGDLLAKGAEGVLEFRLVHNTGAAWGLFSDSTAALGVFSLIVCLVILVLLFTHLRKDATLLQIFSLALVFAGGLGNAYDRIAYSYVVDFIRATFIDFPVFNVADIGVTCGIVLFLVASFAKDIRRSEAAGS